MADVISKYVCFRHYFVLEVYKMKILNITILTLGLLLLVVFSIVSYSNHEAFLYDYQFSYVKIILLKWILFAFFLTSAILLLVNIIAKIVKTGRDLDNKNYIQSMASYLGSTTILDIFLLYVANADVVLYHGWIGIFNFPFFWQTASLLIFWFLMPKLEKHILEKEIADNKSSGSERNSLSILK